MVEQDDDQTVYRGWITDTGGKILMTDRPEAPPAAEGEQAERRVGDRSIGEARRDNAKIEAMFSLKQFPDGHTNQARYCRNIREMGREFALIISENTPGCADQTLAIRHVRQAVIWAQEAVLREGLV